MSDIWRGAETLALAFDIGTTQCACLSRSHRSLASLTPSFSRSEHRAPRDEPADPRPCRQQVCLAIPSYNSTLADQARAATFRWPSSPNSSKIPTVMLYDAHGTAKAFGAETKDDAFIDAGLTECKARLPSNSDSNHAHPHFL